MHKNLLLLQMGMTRTYRIPHRSTVPRYVQLALVSVFITLAENVISVESTFRFSFPRRDTTFCSQPRNVMRGAQLRDRPQPGTCNSCKLYIKRNCGIEWHSFIFSQGTQKVAAVLCKDLHSFCMTTEKNVSLSFQTFS